MHISPTSNHMNGFATSQTGQHKVSVVPHFGKQNKIDTVILKQRLDQHLYAETMNITPETQASNVNLNGSACP